MSLPTGAKPKSTARNFNPAVNAPRCFSLLLCCALLTACGGGGGSSPASVAPAPSPGEPGPAVAAATNDVMRVGDKINIRLSGVPDPDYIVEVQLPSSGEISMPLLTHPFQAVGRTPYDVSAEIVAAYKAGKIYTNPNVTIISEERFVSVGGDVRNPMRVNYTADLTLLGAISACGGFDEYASRKAVRIIRGQQVMQVDAVAASKTAGADPALFPGDQIYVPRTMF